MFHIQLSILFYCFLKNKNIIHLISTIVLLILNINMIAYLRIFMALFPNVIFYLGRKKRKKRKKEKEKKKHPSYTVRHAPRSEGLLSRERSFCEQGLKQRSAGAIPPAAPWELFSKWQQLRVICFPLSRDLSMRLTEILPGVPGFLNQLFTSPLSPPAHLSKQAGLHLCA